MPSAREEITAPFQIIVEGQDDCDFFVRLLRDSAIEDFQVGCGRGEDKRCLGKDGFSVRIGVIQDTSSKPIKGYLIIADTDDNPKERFESACKHLKARKLPIPAQPLTVKIDPQTGIKTAVIMLPSADIQGGLETILVTCCDALRERQECVTAFCACLARPEGKKLDADKLRLRAIIASTHPEDPSMSTSYWLAANNRPFQMNHASLSQLIEFIRNFSQ